MKQLLLICAVVALVGCGKKGVESPTVEITNPIVEKAIRKELNKQEGELTKADLEKVTRLELWNNQLTEVPKELEKLTKLTSLALNDNQLTDVKELEKLTQLELLFLTENPDLTKVQIDELKKALPNCRITSNFTK